MCPVKLFSTYLSKQTKFLRRIHSSAGVLPEKSSCKPKSLNSEACTDFLSPDKVVDAIEYLIGHFYEIYIFLIINKYTNLYIQDQIVFVMIQTTVNK